MLSLNKNALMFSVAPGAKDELFTMAFKSPSTPLAPRLWVTLSDFLYSDLHDLLLSFSYYVISL